MSSTLRDHAVSATIAVKDLPAARKFYEGTLGMQVFKAQGEEAVVYNAGPTKLMVYHSQFAGTNQATVATWAVGNDIDSVVKSLGEQGVKFEHYDMPNVVRKGDIHEAGGIRNAWFKDPEGNIHGIVNQ
jgi:catechol 2,3-dioxygenase-like lactoylglutathione lyase family enzyme